MPGCHMLVFYSEIRNADLLVNSMLNALSHAVHPFGVHFAVPAQFEPEMAEALENGAEVLRNVVAYTHAENTLADAATVLREETHFLSLRGTFEFSDKWDRALLSRLRAADGESPLISATVSTTAEHAPQAYLPALAERFDSQKGVAMTRGLPLVCCARPVRTMLVDPSCFFGTVDFLLQAETAYQTLSMAAYVAGYHVLALEKPVLWPVQEPGEKYLLAPGTDMLPKPHLMRFEQLSGFSFEQKRVSVRTQLGLFSTENGYEQQLPQKLPFLFWQRLKSRIPMLSQNVPLTVTAFCELPQTQRPDAEYLIRFSFLKSLLHLPLTLFTGGRQERALRAAFPNTFAYPDNAVLPKSLLADGMTETEHLKRSKFFLLQKVAKTHPEADHFAWVDTDILSYPICPQAILDFSALMDDKIHLATVEGQPDGSFIVVPARHLKLMTREAFALSQVDAALKRSFSERAMLRRLIEKFPDLFELHVLPRRQRLFLTGFDPLLLSEGSRVQSLRDTNPNRPY